MSSTCDFIECNPNYHRIQPINKNTEREATHATAAAGDLGQRDAAAGATTMAGAMWGGAVRGGRAVEEQRIGGGGATIFGSRLLGLELTSIKP